MRGRAAPGAEWPPAVLTTLLQSALAWPFAAVGRLLAPLASMGGGRLPAVADLDAALSERAGRRFVPSAPRSRRRAKGPVDPAAYDAAIVESARVPTREQNAHDLANALVWGTFPRTKAAIHRRQLAVVRAAAAGAVPGRPWARSEEGDAIAMLDEGGLLVATRQGLGAAVQAELERGDDAALTARVAQGDALGVVFGHALVEHLGRPAEARPPALAGLAIAFEVEGDPRAVDLGALDRLAASYAASSEALRRRKGHGIAAVDPSVLGTRAP